MTIMVLWNVKPALAPNRTWKLINKGNYPATPNNRHHNHSSEKSIYIPSLMTIGSWNCNMSIQHKYSLVYWCLCGISNTTERVLLVWEFEQFTFIYRWLKSFTSVDRLEKTSRRLPMSFGQAEPARDPGTLTVELTLNAAILNYCIWNFSNCICCFLRFNPWKEHFLLLY